MQSNLFRYFLSIVFGAFYFTANANSADLTAVDVIKKLDNELHDIFVAQRKSPYEQQSREKALAICINWKYVCFADGKILGLIYPVKEGAIAAWSAAQGWSSLSIARTKAISQCSDSPFKRDCDCLIFKENDQVTITVPREVVRRLNEEKQQNRSLMTSPEGLCGIIGVTRERDIR
jgi:hypothetical protein